jgi:hypothetical protein
MVSHMNSHHKTLNEIPIRLHIQHASSPAMLTGPLLTLQQQRHLANINMYQFCGGNANYMRISHSHPKPSFTMKTRDLSSLLILFREGTGQVLDNAHGNVCFGVVNGTPCTMHSLAWDDTEEECMAFQAIAKSTPGQVIDLPTPPDHIIIDVKTQAGTQLPKHLNLAPDANFIRILIGLTA